MRIYYHIRLEVRGEFGGTAGVARVRDTQRAPGFDAIELELGSLWADVEAPASD
jgi:hypothetical protein